MIITSRRSLLRVELKIFLVRGPVIIIVYGECYILGVKIINQKIIWNNNKTLPIEKRDSTKIRLIGNKHQLKGPFSKKINSNLGMSIWKELSDDIFGTEPNQHVVYLAVKQYLAAQRQGTHKVKTHLFC